MKYIVYAIKSESRKFTYIGLTSNLDNRLKRHFSGWEKSTRAYRPLKLVYTEICEDRPSARVREKYFKSGVGREFLKTKI